MIQFLNGLNDNYSALRNQILLMEPLPTMNKAFALVLQIEQQKSSNLPVDMNALSLEHNAIVRPKKTF